MLGWFCRTQTLNACSASGRGTAPDQDSELPEQLQAISEFVPASPCTFFWFPTPEGIEPKPELSIKLHPLPAQQSIGCEICLIKYPRKPSLLIELCKRLCSPWGQLHNLIAQCLNGVQQCERWFLIYLVTSTAGALSLGSHLAALASAEGIPTARGDGLSVPTELNTRLTKLCANVHDQRASPGHP